MSARGHSDTDWPDWWQWPIELTSHLIKRMFDRGFSETELRDMLEMATAFHPDVEAGRFVIDTALRGQRWQIIVEPDDGPEIVVVITAYPLD